MTSTGTKTTGDPAARGLSRLFGRNLIGFGRARLLGLSLSPPPPLEFRARG